MSAFAARLDPVMGVADLRAFLEGAWSLQRIVEDRRAETRGVLDGRVDFLAEGAALMYREHGILILGAGRYETSRLYRFEFPQVHRAEVSFEDGQPFHTLDLSCGRWSVAHDCGDDRYQGTHLVVGQDEWRVRWRVRGPRKDQRLDSRYRRTG